MTTPVFEISKAVLVALATAVIGYLVFPLLGLSDADPRLLTSVALLIGAFVGGLIFALRPSEKPEEQVSKTIFVGNLPFKASEQDLSHLFSRYGEVRSARIMRHRKSRRPRGFAFVEMPESQADAAIKALDGQEFLGRQLRVREGSERKADNEG